MTCSPDTCLYMYLALYLPELLVYQTSTALEFVMIAVVECCDQAIQELGVGCRCEGHLGLRE